MVATEDTSDSQAPAHASDTTPSQALDETLVGAVGTREPPVTEGHAAAPSSEIDQDILERTTKQSLEEEIEQRTACPEQPATTTESTADLDIAIAQAVFMSRVPFSMLENPFWVDAISKLRPGYHPPDQTRLKTLLLESEYTRASDEVQRLVTNCKKVCITSKGWVIEPIDSVIARDSNTIQQNRAPSAIAVEDETPVFGPVDFVVTMPQPLYYKSLSHEETKAVPTPQPHAPIQIARAIRYVIEEVGKNKVAAVVTDNPPDIAEAWQILQEQYPSISFYGSSLHNLQSLITSLLELEWTRDLLDKMAEVVGYFALSVNATTLRHAQMEKLGKTISLGMPNPKSWSESTYALFALCASRGAIEALAGISSDLEDSSAAVELSSSTIEDSKVKELICDRDGFWSQLLNLYDFLHPFTYALIACESQHSTLSTVYRDLMSLREHLSSTNMPIKNEAKKLYKKTFKLMYHPIMLVAYELDPKCHVDVRRTMPLTEEQNGLVSKMIAEMVSDPSAAEMALSELGNFRAHQGVFEEPKIWESAALVDSVSWWRDIEANAPSLASVALQVLLMPVSCITVEHTERSAAKSQTELDSDQRHRLDYIRFNLSALRELR